jgi:hypothetical protein
LSGSLGGFCKVFQQKKRFKHLFAHCGFKTLIFAPCALFHIADGISFVVKDRYTSVHKLTEVHVSTFKKLTRVLYPIKNKIKQ